MTDWDTTKTVLAALVVVLWLVGFFGFHTIDGEMSRKPRSFAMWLCLLFWPIAIVAAFLAGLYDSVNTYANQQKPKG